MKIATTVRNSMTRIPIALTKQRQRKVWTGMMILPVMTMATTQKRGLSPMIGSWTMGTFDVNPDPIRT
jgi:hypothetical protein